MKVFLDTNIFLDTLVIRENQEDNENALVIMKIAAMNEFEFFISPITVSNSFYITRKDQNAVKKIKSSLQNISILPIDCNDVQFAINSSCPDKEDAMQISCADRGHCDLIITRDTRHFSNAPIPVLTPAEFLERLKQNR